MCATVIAHGDPAPVLDAPEHVLNCMPLLVEIFVVCVLDFAVFLGRDAGRYPPFPQGFPEPVSIITTVCKKFFGIG